MGQVDMKTTRQFSAARTTKDTVPVTAHMQNGAVISGELFIFKQGQRLQDLLNENNRQFLPLCTSSGSIMFINRDRLEFITERLQETAPDEPAAS